MANKAFNLRGTNGSGKTHVARRLLELSHAKPTRMAGRKPIMYHGILHRRPLCILGSYETNCGGCDTIPKVAWVANLLDELLGAHGEGIVFYEGLMISHMIGTVGAMAKKYNDQHVMGFLNTPLEVCIERVKKRRLSRGNDKPFDPERTLVGDYRAVQAARQNALSQGFHVVDIDYEVALRNVLTHLAKL